MVLLWTFVWMLLLFFFLFVSSEVLSIWILLAEGQSIKKSDNHPTCSLLSHRLSKNRKPFGMHGHALTCVPAKNKLNQPPPGDLCYRPLQASDMDEMIALHQEWFPVSYDQDFYNKSVTGNLHSIVAVLPQNGGSHVAPALPSGQTAEENILGIWILDSACFFLQCKVLV